MAYMDQEAPFYIWNRDVCSRSSDKQTRVLILGDSVANAAYMPEMLSDDCLNLSLGGITPMETYYILKDYLQNHPAPESVYISFLDQHLQAEDCFWLRTMYSHRFTPSETKEMLLDAAKAKETTVAIDHAQLHWLSYELYLPNKYITSLRRARFFRRLEENRQSYDSSTLHYGRYISRGTQQWQGGKISFDTFYVAPLFDDYYKRLIELCEQNGIRTHLIKLPMPKSISFSAVYEQQLAEYYQTLKLQYPDVILDRWNSYGKKYFSDEWHLNNQGALRFSLELKEKYPEDFDTRFSMEQLKGIDDYLIQEDDLSRLLTWTKHCDAYCLIACGKTEALEKEIAEKYSDGALHCTRIEDGSSTALTVSSCEPSDAAASLPLSGFPTSGFTASSLHIVIYNLQSGEVVCEKDFEG